MSDMPERIKVAKCHQFTDPDDLYVCHPKLLNPAAVPYIRADIAKAELDAAVRAEREAILALVRKLGFHEDAQTATAEMIEAAIRERGK